ncbi:MAG: DUF5777 family beta-barrel protein [Lutibacter sp.]|uniref:outer membrane beta-barrel protein n=1 Tax=Lutibacter sp. TaxID=1925666 RepID=UPI00299DC11E|nr:outer membrane beta-barrel protein [Lutibacter sp.]MDX1827991.1 DUF5777 family beta-barrel protein [Lutibacter sp.]
MKKLLLTVVITVVTMVSMSAQTSFGVTSGYLSAESKLDLEGTKFTDSNSGFYVGIVADIKVSEEFHVQPELVYTNISDLSFMQIPIMAKFYVADKFSLQVGPEITYTLEKTYGDATKFNIGLGLGAAYDFSEKFFIESRYTFQVNNYYTGNQDVTSRINFLNVGLGYKFN